MESLIFAFGAVAPIIFTVALGYFLKKIGLLPLSLTKPINKLVFRVLLPCMLFLNVYNIGDFSSIDARYIIYAVVAVIVIFVLALPITLIVTKDNSMRGPMLQCSFRSNYALIGIPLAISLCGEEAGALATILSAVSIPAFNILAVISLTVFDRTGKGFNIKKILLGIIKNPLILSIAFGFVAFFIKRMLAERGVNVEYSSTDKNLYTAIYTTVEYMSRSATPIALLVLGAQFEFSAIKSMRREIITGVLMRNLFTPIIGLCCTMFFDFLNPIHYACLVALFSTPVAVSSVPMAQEMGANAEYAGQMVVFTTLFSSISIFVAVAILKSVGIF